MTDPVKIRLVHALRRAKELIKEVRACGIVNSEVNGALREASSALRMAKNEGYE